MGDAGWLNLYVIPADSHIIIHTKRKIEKNKTYTETCFDNLQVIIKVQK